MSDFIDPTTQPWGRETDDIWEWLKAVWEATVATHPVADTRENRIREYRSVTQFWRKRLLASGLSATYSLLQFTRKQYEERKVDPPDNQGSGYRFR